MLVVCTRRRVTLGAANLAYLPRLIGELSGSVLQEVDKGLTKIHEILNSSSQLADAVVRLSVPRFLPMTDFVAKM